LKSRFVSILLALTFILTACATKASASLEQSEVKVSLRNVEAVLQFQPEADECLACHANKERLIETAKPEEIVEAESSGAG